LTDSFIETLYLLRWEWAEKDLHDHQDVDIDEVKTLTRSFA